MTSFKTHPALKPAQDKFFKYTWEMYAFEFKYYYDELKFQLPGGGTRKAKCRSYISGCTKDRNNQYYWFWSKAKKFYKKENRLVELDWLQSHYRRVQKCFYGQGMPEEISTILTMSVEIGHKSDLEIVPWAEKTFGVDCVGFVCAYYNALGTFDGQKYSIPKYRTTGGIAKTIKDLTYDCAVLFARPKSGGKGKWEVRPNPGNGAHIMVTDCWNEYGKSMWISESGSSKGGTCTSIYDIVDAPDTTEDDKAIWTIRRRNGGGKIKVFITREMPYWAEPVG